MVYLPRRLEASILNQISNWMRRVGLVITGPEYSTFHFIKRRAFLNQ
jgi:hypothetical protein